MIGWRPPTPAIPAGLVVAENDKPPGMAVVALAAPQRSALADLLERHGRRHPSGTITIPHNCLEAKNRYSSRTPTHGVLREPAAVDLRPS